MFLANIIIILVVVAISPNCYAELWGLQPFLNQEYKLVSCDANYDQVMKELGIGRVQRQIHEKAKPRLKLTWNPETDLYNLLVKSPLTLHEDIFKVGIIFLIIFYCN